MFYFSYNNYMDSMENGEINEIKKVEENIEKYELINEKREKSSLKKEIVEMLKNKKNLREFINDFFNPFEMNNAKILKNLNKESIICKIEEKEIFVLIKVIDEIDCNITYKMFEDSINIIRKWKEEQCTNKRKPIVIPIVLYLGNEIWNMNSYNISNKINYLQCEENEINFSYNFINVNLLEIEELIKMKSEVAKKLVNNKIKFYK